MIDGLELPGNCRQ